MKNIILILFVLLFTNCIHSQDIDVSISTLTVWGLHVSNPRVISKTGGFINHLNDGRTQLGIRTWNRMVIVPRFYLDVDIRSFHGLVLDEYYLYTIPSLSYCVTKDDTITGRIVIIHCSRTQKFGSFYDTETGEYGTVYITKESDSTTGIVLYSHKISQTSFVVLSYRTNKYDNVFYLNYYKRK